MQEHRTFHPTTCYSSNAKYYAEWSRTILRGGHKRFFRGIALIASIQNGSAIAQNPKKLLKSERREGKIARICSIQNIGQVGVRRGGTPLIYVVWPLGKSATVWSYILKSAIATVCNEEKARAHLCIKLIFVLILLYCNSFEILKAPKTPLLI